jgi:hypothetical protein
MAQAIGARRDGDAFQARVFWLKAAALLDPEGRVVRVGFEHGPQGFDDVWVEYDKTCRPPDQFGKPIDIERFQCKWHVAPGQYTYADLASSDYIGAKTSLLQRAHRAYAADTGLTLHSRIRLVTNHQVNPSDTLYSLIRNRSYTLHLDRLFDNSTDRSACGQVRKLWREHLEVDDNELKALCAALGLNPVKESLEGLKEQLDLTFCARGLARIERGSATRYDDTPFQWASQGRNVFDRESFRQACADEGFLTETSKCALMFGVKSFQHAYDSLEDRCFDTLDLINHFDERFIQDQAAWNQTLLPKLGVFIRSAMRKATGPRLRIALDAHSTLAFAAGALLNTKCGRLVELEQRSPHPVIWTPDDHPVDPAWPKWDIHAEALSGDGSDIVVGIALSQSLEAKVREYLLARLPQAGRLVIATPVGGPSHSSVICGSHANQLAEKLAANLKTQRELAPRSSPPTMHIFIAAPNAFTFYFGRHIESLKPMILYEFDFQSQRDRTYEPSLSITGQFPPSKIGTSDCSKATDS